tara:strand:+ start:4994 stop:5362 length:369 start_codon:yes stop_codon:yes gene_type:complete
LNWFFLLLSLIVSLEILSRIKIYKNFNRVKNIFSNLISSLSDKKNSDAEKQQILFKFSLEIFKASVEFLLFFTILVIPFFIINYLISFYNYNILKLFLSLHGSILSLLFSIIYIYIRNKFAD